MALACGFPVGPYEICGPLGEGGMGTVYRARDTRLDRDVALKVLRDEVMGDHDRRLRFLQEAKAVSALNHPNIVTLHDVGAEGDLVYMVMELVDGRSLDHIVPAGGMQVADVLRIGAQIADAFAKAHATGIVHRDLKPANVMVQPDGRVKVLDFGLAKLQSRVEAPSSATVTQTAEGTILGTAAYMSPEQAEGKTLDARSDIFSFGALLYELCTGRRAFQGESQASVLAEVLTQEPQPLAELRADVPAELARLITRCLRKDPARRAQSMADLKVAFEELGDELSSRVPQTAAPPSAAPAPSRWPQWLTGLAAIGVLTILGFLWWSPRGAVPATGGEARLEPVPLTSFPGREVEPDLSPDGNQVAFGWTGEHGDNQDIYIKLLNAGPPLRLTSDPREDGKPRWSPDGRWVAFARRVERDLVAVMMVPALGGPERRITQIYTRLAFDSPSTSFTWTPDGQYLLVSGAQTREPANELYRVSIDTGEAKRIATTGEPGVGYADVALAPDGRTLAALRFPSGTPVEIFDMSPSWEVERSRLLANVDTEVHSIAWAADSRELVYRIGATIPLPLYRVSVDGGEPQPMSWVGPDADWPAIDARNSRLVFARNQRDTNIWRAVVTAPGVVATTLEPLAGSSFREVFPQYSPDGRRIAFHSNRDGSIQIWTANADGSDAVQLSNMAVFATTGSSRWSPDSQRIVFDSNADGTYQLYEIAAEGGQAKALTRGTSSNFIGAWSPDGQWIYFTSDRSGRPEIWRMPSAGGEAVQVTRNGGSGSTVSPDGRWVYYTKGDGAEGLWRMPVDGGTETLIVQSLYRYNFALTEAGLYFTASPGPSAISDRGLFGVFRHSSIKYLDFKSTRITDVLAVDRPDLGLALSPDGRSLLFTTLDYAGTDLMLVENFR